MEVLSRCTSKYSEMSVHIRNETVEEGSVKLPWRPLSMESDGHFRMTEH